MPLAVAVRPCSPTKDTDPAVAWKLVHVRVASSRAVSSARPNSALLSCRPSACAVPPSTPAKALTPVPPTSSASVTTDAPPASLTVRVDDSKAT